ncbi:hypothetical protein ABZ865_39750 [Streptomyces sp. NPDC047085]|uniref:hypothetical protein n=1 Tax=Streptomyces sp. NPDC047085 TaxID=3155140 RepID=UPI0033D98506
MATALRAMHEAPTRLWTVAELACIGPVSRSTLTARFKDTVGQGPRENLTRWRIELASRHLRDGTETVASIAQMQVQERVERRFQAGRGNAAA